MFRKAVKRALFTSIGLKKAKEPHAYKRAVFIETEPPSYKRAVFIQKSPIQSPMHVLQKAYVPKRQQRLIQAGKPSSRGGTRG